MSLSPRRPRRRPATRLAALAALPALLLVLSACGGSDDADDKDSDTPDGDAAPAGLSFAAVEDVVASEAAPSDTCAEHRWTDVVPATASVFADATSSQELGCWATSEDVSASIPGEVYYAEFADEATATAFLADNFQFSYDKVQDGAAVVLVNIVELPDLADEIADLCDCDVTEGATP